MKKTRYATTLMLAFLMMLAVVSIAPVYADTTGDSGGTATVGNESPFITTQDITDIGSTSVDTEQIDVWTEYWVTWTGGDPNKITDIDVITIVIFDNVLVDKGSGDAEANHYTFTWTESTDTFVEVGPGAVHLIAANCSDPSNKELESGDWVLAFKVAKVGHHETTADWDISITITDEQAASDEDATLSFGLNYYAELTVPVDTTHSWASLTAGLTNQTMTTPGDGNIGVSVISNADFDLQGKGSGDLDNSGETIPIGNVLIHKDTLGSAIALTTGYLDIVGLTALTEGPAEAHTFILWINVPDPCEDGPYTYTLSVQVEKA